MAFFKFRNRGPQANEGRNTSVSAAPAESIEAMRRRARHRLLGAAILVLAGVVGFPLLFDTQPRPVAVDIPIELPDRNKVKPLQLPAAPAPSAAAPSSSADGQGASASGSSPRASGAVGGPPAVSSVAPVRPAARSDDVITETADGSEIQPARPVSPAPPGDTRPAAHADAKPEHKPEARNETKPRKEPEAKPETRPEAKTASSRQPEDAARARALLEGKSASAAASAGAAAAKPAATDDSGRFIVQVGAFAEADKAREVRQKLEKAGLKTFTSVVKTNDGERTRVRVGPFTSRAEAERAAGKVKGLSLSAAVLGL